MKYKVWGKAKAVLKPHKRHYMTLGMLLFIAGLIITIAVVVRLGMLYSGSFYSGVREPYIQSLGETSVIIKWQSEKSTASRLEVGEGLNYTDISLDDERAATLHEMRIDGLKPNTLYNYRIYHAGQIFRGGEEYWFKTAPITGSDSPTRLWIMGDPGRQNQNIKLVQSGMKKWLNENKRSGQKGLDLIISTGDNAYLNGTNEEYQLGLFNTHSDLFKNYSFFPVYGNTDAKGWSFFNIFSFPKEAELGGVASGTERYYSIDYASSHIIFLDSNEGGFTPNDEMITWLKADLKATKQKWIIVFFHHPPYTRGSHNSNDAKDSGNRMFNMRKRVLPVLEKASVDLVITGHSHSYERSFKVKCHYGVSSSFEQKSIIQKGPDFKTSINREAYQGTIYTVMGSSALAVQGRFDHPAMAVSKAELGSMVLDIEGEKLISRFIDINAEVIDQFEIIKSADKSLTNNVNKACQ